MNDCLVEVELGYICNYACAYCFPISTSGGNWVAYKPLVKFINDIDPDRVVLAGGEPTYYPNINSLLKELVGRTVYVTTNGSRSLEWWKEYYKYIDVLTLSYHVNDTPFIEFYEKVEFLSTKMLCSINIPVPISQYNECVIAAEIFTKLDNVFVSLKPLVDVSTGSHFKYPDVVLEDMAVLRKPTRQSLSNKSKRKNERGHISISKKTNRYKGFKCWKGIDLLKVMPSGDIYKAGCEPRVATPIGNIKNEYTIPTEPSTCEYDECLCITDLNQIRKEEPI